MNFLFVGPVPLGRNGKGGSALPKQGRDIKRLIGAARQNRHGISVSCNSKDAVSIKGAHRQMLIGKASGNRGFIIVNDDNVKSFSLRNEINSA